MFSRSTKELRFRGFSIFSQFLFSLSLFHYVRLSVQTFRYFSWCNFVSCNGSFMWKKQFADFLVSFFILVLPLSAYKDKYIFLCAYVFVKKYILQSKCMHIRLRVEHRFRLQSVRIKTRTSSSKSNHDRLETCVNKIATSLSGIQ